MVEIDFASTTGAHTEQIPHPRGAERRHSRADTRTRAIVFRALRLLPAELPPRRRGGDAAREYIRAAERAWDRGIDDVEGRPWSLQERHIRAGDLSIVFAEQSARAGYALLAETCPELFVRYNNAEFLIPFGELRNPKNPRIAALDQWCKDAERRQRERELSLQNRDTRAYRLSRIRASLHSRLNRYVRGSIFPGPHLVNPENALAAAAAELERLGPPVQGKEGDRRAFVGAAIGGDFGLSVEEFRPLLQHWNESGKPPFSPDELEDKLQSALRNRKRPVGCRLSTTPSSVAPPAAVTRADFGLVETWNTAWSLWSLSPDICAALAWVSSRGLDVSKLIDMNLVRVLPKLGELAESCRFDKASWAEGGYRLVFPTFDSGGELVGLRARHIDGTEAPRGAKELNPARMSPCGLVFANEKARDMLRGAEVREVWIAEGGPDFLTLATMLPDVAVLGIFAGSWTAEVAAKIPSGAQVVVATDPDKAGQKYARGIAASLIERCEIYELALPQGMDVNKALLAGLLDLSSLRHFGDVRSPATKAPGPVPSPASSPVPGWDQRALDLMARHPFAWRGSARELARALLYCEGARPTPAAVRGLARAFARLQERGALPASIELVAAVPLHLGRQEDALLVSADVESDGHARNDALGDADDERCYELVGELADELACEDGLSPDVDELREDAEPERVAPDDPAGERQLAGELARGDERTDGEGADLDEPLGARMNHEGVGAVVERRTCRESGAQDPRESTRAAAQREIGRALERLKNGGGSPTVLDKLAVLRPKK